MHVLSGPSGEASMSRPQRACSGSLSPCGLRHDRQADRGRARRRNGEPPEGRPLLLVAAKRKTPGPAGRNTTAGERHIFWRYA